MLNIFFLRMCSFFLSAIILYKLQQWDASVKISLKWLIRLQKCSLIFENFLVKNFYQPKKRPSIELTMFLGHYKYRIYSSECLERSFNLEFSKEALIRRRRSFERGAHWIYQRDIKILSTYLLNQTIRTVIITEE